MNTITIPAITDNWALLKPSRTFDISDWQMPRENDPNNLWFESEWFVIDTEGNPLVFGNGWFQNIPTSPDEIERLSRYPSWEQEINTILSSRTQWVFRGKVARITQELYLPSIEISLDKGYAPRDLFRVIFQAFWELYDGLETSGALYLPSGNLPIETPNVPNFANSYYEYLFRERDGFDIADFRWAALQLHRWVEDQRMAVYTFNKIRHLLPFFLALTGNSPIHNNKFRWNVSERTSTKSAWKMTGIPDAIDDTFFSQLQEWLDTTIKSVTPYYYAVRYPRVDIRTIENCSMDMVDDVGIMVACMDLYYRICEKLKQHFLSGEDLPEGIFGKDSSCMVETNVIRENFHRSIRHGTKTRFAKVWWNSREQNFEALSQGLIEWIDDVPTIFPEYIANRLWIHGSDATRHILSQVLSGWNLWERTIKELWLNKDRIIHPQVIPTHILQQFMVERAQWFRDQVRQIL
jgi:hypothetical protein